MAEENTQPRRRRTRQDTDAAPERVTQAAQRMNRERAGQPVNAQSFRQIRQEQREEAARQPVRSYTQPAQTQPVQNQTTARTAPTAPVQQAAQPDARQMAQQEAAARIMQAAQQVQQAPTPKPVQQTQSGTWTQSNYTDGRLQPMGFQQNYYQTGPANAVQPQTAPQAAPQTGPQPWTTSAYSGTAARKPQAGPSSGYRPEKKPAPKKQPVKKPEKQTPPPRQKRPRQSSGGDLLGKLKLVGILAVAVAILAVIISTCVKNAQESARQQEIENYVSASDSTFCQGVYVDGISLGGMTAEEGYNAVMTQAQNRDNSWYVNLTYQGQVVVTLNASQLGMKTDVVDVMREAWSQGHTGTTEERKAAMDQLLVTSWQGYTATPSSDTAIVDNVLQQLKDNFYVAPQNAALISFDPSASYPFIFQDEVVGRTLDTEPVKESLYQMVSTMQSGDLELNPTEIQPDVTVDDLKVNLSMRASVYTPISSASSENRTNNIRRCFQLISGSIVQPGAKFSFNDTVGKRTEENGFYEAIEYAYGQEVMGIGGGTCQASTTLYQAVVTAGLQVTDRSPHSKAVSYANYGEDATVYWGTSRKIDLVFKNNTDQPIYIVAAVQSDPSNRKRFIARVTIYGADLGDIRYELVSETVEVLEAPEEPTYVKDTKAEYVTYTDQTKEVSKAKEGYVVDSFRVTYQGDQEVSRELLYEDTYKPQAAQVYVGVTKRE